jgi:hypothetical protein
VPGDHNTARNGFYYNQVARFLFHHLLDQPLKDLLSLTAPPSASPLLLEAEDKWFMCKMLRSGTSRHPFNVIMIISRAHGIVLHAPFSSEIAEMIAFGRIRAYGVRDETFILKWIGEGADGEVASEAENDLTPPEPHEKGVFYATFYTAESSLILGAVENAIEYLLSSKMGVDNIDRIIENIVKEKELSGKPFTREEILDQIHTYIQERKDESESCDPNDSFKRELCEAKEEGKEKKERKEAKEDDEEISLREVKEKEGKENEGGMKELKTKTKGKNDHRKSEGREGKGEGKGKGKGKEQRKDWWKVRKSEVKVEEKEEKGKEEVSNL